MSEGSRYSVGIDLGTTNSVLAYLDVTSSAANSAAHVPETGNPTEQVLAVDQLTQPGVVEARAQLPSFLYQAHEAEVSATELSLPWGASGSQLVGYAARYLGAKTPMRLVASAKSWLCHSGVDRRSPLLPLNAPDEVARISPLAASAAYLEHLKCAWNHRFPEYPLEQQEITLTVPASFDPAARDLTAEAARSIGLNRLTLLEEPQAALYSWVNRSGDQWREQVSVGDVVLVVDIGGGTTDLSLVAVTEQDGNLELNRIAVGDHILLGGDNMDLALAYRVKAKLDAEGKALQPWQIQALTHGCRDAKEALLGDAELDAVPIVVPSRGSKLLGSTLRTELTREEVEQTLVDGFFPQVGITEHPRQQPRGALTQMGLPYAQDAGVTRHLAAFLCRQANAAQDFFGSAQDFIKPTAVLFNGGVLKAPKLAQRLMSVINGWLQQAGAEPARLLDGADLDLAVARGAAYYGYVRQGHGVRIRGGLASAYYVGIESAMPAVPGMPPPLQALCVAPFGMEEGTETTPGAQEFGLVVGEPVTFRFFGSTVRRDDQPGMLLDSWSDEELQELPPIQASLPAEGRSAGEVVAVTLAARVNELGTLCLEAIPREGDQRWQVEFDVRDQ
ncbi:Hsp70 family protein [Ketobacter sp.]|uniref:Hsp70 family protein n=1 Tax=Ketobacter sp. TaxID=2083498 RepID=UPI000F1A7335|nr:Hsp70 family protein [Ketobacter sp.]RLT98080.1 MAG: Hsp70 family protein [Ketobacter sp.]